MRTILVTTALLGSVLLNGLTSVAAAQEQRSDPRFGSAELAERTLQRRAVESVIWGMPAVNYDLMRQEMLGKTAGKVGQVIYWSRPLDSKNQTLTPNPDALYFKTLFNTKDGPIVLDLPAGDKNGSFNGNIVNVWQMPLEDAGLLGIDKGKGGKFLILPPGYKGTPPKGYIPLQSDTFGGYALIRTMTRASRSSQIPDLQKNADGSIDIYFGPTAPAGKDSNWVPTDPARRFEVMFRAYAPTKPLFEKTWVLPDVEKVAAQ